MQRLKGHHRRDLRGRDRRPAPVRAEQVRIIGVGEHLGPVPRQEGEHAALPDQMPDQARRVQQLPIHPFEALHAKIIPDVRTHGRQNTPMEAGPFSAAS
jgi:hypothetical protein